MAGAGAHAPRTSTCGEGMLAQHQQDEAFESNPLCPEGFGIAIAASHFAGCALYCTHAFAWHASNSPFSQLSKPLCTSIKNALKQRHCLYAIHVPYVGDDLHISLVTVFERFEFVLDSMHSIQTDVDCNSIVPDQVMTTQK